MKKKKRRRLVFAIMRLSVMPITILGIILTVYSQNSVREGMVFEVQKNLSGIAHNIISMYNMLDAGDFSYEKAKVMKGETDFTSDYRLLDDVKNDTGADVTIFIGDKRCLTTLVDHRGKRLIGTKVNDEVKDVVFGKGEEYFAEDVDILGADYFGYYVPIRNDENQVIGISFAGKSVESIRTSMKFMIQGNIIICLFVILLAVFLCNISAQKMVDTIQTIKQFLSKVAHGDFSHEMPKQVLKRRDELAEMGEHAVTVSNSLEELVSCDPLTKLLNRRAGWQQLRKRTDQQPFTIVMADIDFFKNVNDTYGHDQGDKVLCFVAEQLKEMMSDVGFSARWGGEEFLLGYDGEMEDMAQVLSEFREKILVKKFFNGETEFSISMTFGVAQHYADERLEDTIERADELLYYGKQHGRNQVVFETEND